MVDEVEGQFETHLTVRADGDAGALHAMESWVAARGMKFSHIVLATGTSPSQPIATWSAPGSLVEQRVAADRHAGEFRAAGLDVVRTKIEAAPWNVGVPRDDAEASAQPDGRYFEHHLNLVLGADADLGALAVLAIPHGAHVSRNARRLRADGRHERFVTQRCHRVGAAEAARRLNGLVLALAAFEIVEREEEYVVFDSNLALDAGWI